MKTLLLIILTLAFSQVCAIRPAPAAVQDAPQTFINATIHTGDGEVLAKAMMVITSGQISYLGAYQQSQEQGQVIDVNQHIFIRVLFSPIPT
jgi:hypothetical protein